MIETAGDTQIAMSEASDGAAFDDRRLDLFVQRNPEATIEQADGVAVIRKPWGDDTILLRVGTESPELIAALNDVRLPPRFSAVWHQDTKDLEFVYAPIPSDLPEAKRSFTFSFRGADYACEFAAASAAVELLSHAVRPLPQHSETNHRNLTVLRSFFRFRAANPDAPLAAQVATSFWIRAVQLPEELLVDFARHLNFYMRYFDRESPVVVIHNEPEPSSKSAKRVRYPHGAFPNSLLGRPLDPYLLALWESATFSYDPFREFVYNYQVLEYAAFYFLREEVFQVVRRIVAAPDVLVRLDEAARQILDAVVDDRTSDDAKIIAVVQKAVDPAALWREIEPNAAFFAKPTDFDGNFSISPILKAGWAYEDFKAAWLPKVPDTLRKLRNALVHARETRQSCCIAPSAANQLRLRPWAKLMAAVSAQVIIFGEQHGT